MEAERIERPQLVLGLVAPVGTSLKYFTNLLTDELKRVSYECQHVRMSAFTRLFKLDTPYPGKADEFTRIWSQMDRGNEAREKAGASSILAKCAVRDIAGRRKDAADRLEARAFLIRQLKHPEEVHEFRRVYEDGFHLLGLYSSLDDRIVHLNKSLGIHKEKVKKLIERDEHELSRWGQHLRDTYHLADIFFDLGQPEAAVKKEIERWVQLLCGLGIRTPSVHEFGMFQAKAASLRSGSLARQVGAAILSANHEVISVGSNEVPCSGGGQYWEGAANDCRDHVRGSDSNDETISEIIEEAVSAIRSQGDAEFKSDQKWMDIKDWLAETARSAFANTRIMHLTEFGRAVHAEMEAILAAARIGVSVRDAILYTTTFPCHNCAKHIVDAGIREVVYVEPYPKSLGPDLHGDAISVDEKTEVQAKKGRDKNGAHWVDARVRFRPFVGVAPRRYMDLFSMTSKVGRKIARKEKGKPIMDRYFFRLQMPYSDCFEREGLCVEEVNSMIGKEKP